MRNKIKCPQCGLVQWDDGSCKRCKQTFAGGQPALPETAVPPEAVATQEALTDAFDQASQQTAAAPSVPAGPPEPFRDPSYGSITPATLAELEQAGPWMRFVGTVGTVVAVLNLLAGGLVLLLLGNYAAKLPPGAPSLGWIAMFYLFLGLVYWVLSSRLKTGGAALQNLRAKGSEALYEFAVSVHKFWRIVGLLTLTSIAILVVIVLIAFLFS